MAEPICVLIVDDSAVVRQVLTEILSADPEIEVMAKAPDPLIAADKILKQRPDVITLDVEMPRMDAKQFLEDSNVMICGAVKAAARARVRRLSSLVNAPRPKLAADVMLNQPRQAENFQTTEKVIAVGASTGGTEALRVFLQGLPYDAPCIVIVQHMPQQFTAAFAKRLNGICRIAV